MGSISQTLPSLFLQMTEVALSYNKIYSSPIGFGEWLWGGRYGKSRHKGVQTKGSKLVFWWEGGLRLEGGEEAVDVLFALCSSERNLITPGYSAIIIREKSNTKTELQGFQNIVMLSMHLF